MDVVTQCVLGASAAQTFLGRRLPRSAWLAGLLGGYVPDADIFIRPAGDPMGGLLWHRHFTHGVGFMPVGAAIAVLPFLLFPAGRRALGWLYLAALAGIATHAPLDACTSFGTCLWWPFSSARVSWDLIGIIDPLVTLPLLVTVAWSAVISWRRRHDLERPAPLAERPTRWRTVAGAGFVWAWFYIFAVGGVMHARAAGAAEELARARGHDGAHGLRAMPQPASLLLWRTVYIHDGKVWSDAAHTLPLRPVRVIAGEPQPLLTESAAMARAAALSDRTRGAVAGYYWFTDGYVSPSPDDPSFLGDMRYGIDPQRFSAMWGLRLPAPTEPDDLLL
ncbi:MAG TPA: metal-dependent hydrolase, partial [Phycisphaerales bacterium]|nr:metal-dependent hydrolase [Phycisphaerales bacterium]